jgi:hypothetical protein
MFVCTSCKGTFHKCSLYYCYIYVCMYAYIYTYICMYLHTSSTYWWNGIFSDEGDSFAVKILGVIWVRTAAPPIYIYMNSYMYIHKYIYVCMYKYTFD